MAFDNVDEMTRRVSLDALEEADELLGLLRRIKPCWKDRERIETIGRAFGWNKGTLKDYLLRLFFNLRDRDEL